MASRINFIDIYSFYDEIDASVIETLLEDYDISCAVRTLKLPAACRGESSTCKEVSISDSLACPPSKLRAGRSLCMFNPSADPDAYFEKRIAVEEDKVENARRIINDARKSGVISREGRFRV
ncbi:MAG: hypothetical protein HZB22_03350 [Deltaproteobacteria bacterium]|nr:hypothetical protein [Deltaproteobacteria bacterium]